MIKSAGNLQEPVFDPDENTFTDSFGNTLGGIHPETQECITLGCVVHAPTKHRMRGFPLYWRGDRYLFERICPHGIGHPDPDDINYKERIGLTSEGIHGCDGCCS